MQSDLEEEHSRHISTQDNLSATAAQLERVQQDLQESEAVSAQRRNLNMQLEDALGKKLPQEQGAHRSAMITTLNNRALRAEHGLERAEHSHGAEMEALRQAHARYGISSA